MLTTGIDLAASDSTTAVAWIRWTASGGYLQELVIGAGDDQLLRALAEADKAGIDCPLGWPEPFVEFIVAHHRRTLANRADMIGRDWRRGLAWRRTDLVTHELTGRLSLSVAADRIAHTAMRCAALLARLAEDGHPVDRTGGGTVVEVYPAASLKQWGLPHRSYKGRQGSAVLNNLVDRLTNAAPWLRLGAFELMCRSSDHALDAVVAALTARAAAIGEVTGPGPADLAAATTEGWIALPTAPVGSLLTGSAEAAVQR